MLSALRLRRNGRRIMGLVLNSRCRRKRGAGRFTRISRLRISPGRRYGATAGGSWVQGGAVMRGSAAAGGQSQKFSARRTTAACLMVFALGGLPGGCFGETFQRGYVLPDGALQQIPLGASQEQVLLVLGTPSTVATVSGEAFYYISQRADRPIAFMRTKVTDQRVIAVYFDKDRKVQRLAEYGMKDGKVFDFVSRTTPTSGNDLNVITTIIHNLEGKGT